MNLELQLSSDELDPDDLQALTRTLRTRIEEETGINAQIPSGAVEHGAKGTEVVDAALILLPIVMPLLLKATSSLCDVFKTAIKQTPSLKITLTVGEKKLTVDAKNFDAKDMESILAQLNHLSR